MKLWDTIMTSRKWQVGTFLFLTNLLHPHFDFIQAAIPAENLGEMTKVGMSLIFGQAIVDHKTKANGSGP